MTLSRYFCFVYTPLVGRAQISNPLSGASCVHGSDQKQTQVGARNEITLPYDVRNALVDTKPGTFTNTSFKAALRICVETMLNDLLPKFRADAERRQRQQHDENAVTET